MTRRKLTPKEIESLTAGTPIGVTKKLIGEKHKKRHKELHKALDELLGDYIDHKYKIGKPHRGLSETPISVLMKWSYEQTKNPTEKNDT